MARVGFKGLKKQKEMQKRNKTIDLAIASAFKSSKHNWFCSEASKVAKIKSGLTKRAPDAGESAHIPGSFLRLILFLAERLRRPRPSAGNANRWLAMIKI